MNRQVTFGEIEYASNGRGTRREKFAAKMERLVPWSEWVAIIEPYYPKTGEVGRQPVGIERMLRMLIVQRYYNLSDELTEEIVDDSRTLRRFVGIDPSQRVPDATTLLNFRHLLEKHGLTEKIFAQVEGKLEESGMLLRTGTIVDATIIEAPSSTKNKGSKRDPEMHQTKKGNEWHFGMKAHIGVDAASGLVHTVEATPANMADITMVGELLHGDEFYVYGDAGYTGAEKREEIKENHGDAVWLTARKRGAVKRMDDGPEKEAVLAEEYAKSSVRSKVEHAFHIVKNLFGYRKTRYKGIAKNKSCLYFLFACANLLIAERRGFVLPNMA